VVQCPGVEDIEDLLAFEHLVDELPTAVPVLVVDGQLLRLKNMKMWISGNSGNYS